MNVLLKKTEPKTLHLSAIPKGDKTALKITFSQNELGIVHKVTAVLLVHGWEILEAVAETSEDGYVQDIFYVQNIQNKIMTDETASQIRKDLELLLIQNLSVSEFLSQKNHVHLPSPHEPKDSKATIRLYNPNSSDYSVMDIIMDDRPGILFQITDILHKDQIDILSFTANTVGGKIRDSFLIRSNQSGTKLNEMQEFKSLSEKLHSIL